MTRRRIASLLVGLAAAGILAGVALAAALTQPAAGAPAQSDPRALVKQLVVQMVRDDYARAWLTLHPAHKAVAGRWEYADCEIMTPIPGRITSLRVTGVTDRRVDLPGVGRVAGKAIAFRLVLNDLVITHTANVVAVDGEWRWILTPERYELYRANGCAGFPPTA
jgi:hypothetical protein